jgi:hypothetical protein
MGPAKDYAMTDFTEVFSRGDAAAELPIQLADELVTGTIRESTAMLLGTKVPTTVRDSRIPVLTARPQAHWINPADTGLAQTTKTPFENKVLIAEELSTIATIPNSILDDSLFGLWDAVKPLLVQSMASALDDAILWNINKPSTFGASVVQAATATGTNVFPADITNSDTDVARTLLDAAILVATQGYNVTSAAVCPGWEFMASAARTPALVNNPIGAEVEGGFPLLLAGMKIHTKPLRWDGSQASAIVGDFANLLVGLRKDVSLELFNTGVISDSSGVVQMNLLQQNATACRVTMRVGFLITNPPTDAALDDTHRCPFALVTPSGEGLRKVKAK